MQTERNTYRVVRLAGRPIIATPAKPLALRLAGLSQYPPNTKKRALLRSALRLAAIGRIDRLVARTSATPFESGEDFGFPEWISEARRLLGVPAAVATIIWPQLVRRKRVYVHLLSPAGAPLAFCKIGLDAVNAARLRNEIDALTVLRERQLALTSVPRVLHHDLAAQHPFVMYEPFPSDLKPLKHSWGELAPSVAEISGDIRRINRAELERCDWWLSFAREGWRLSAEFRSDVEHTVFPVAVCRVQGDATPSNIFRSRDGIWICDWEHSSASGPRRTDELSYYLAANHYQCLLRPAAMLDACLLRFAPARDRASMEELALALAFLCGRNDPRALKIASRWRSPICAHRQSAFPIEPASLPYRAP